LGPARWGESGQAPKDGIEVKGMSHGIVEAAEPGSRSQRDPSPDTAEVFDQGKVIGMSDLI